MPHHEAERSMGSTRPRLLALDTSTQRMVVALADGDVTHGVDEDGGARASSRLLPAVDEVMQRAGLELRHLDAVAFARGPGAFTGLRTAASAAQGLAFGLGVPALSLDSLMVAAEDACIQASLRDRAMPEGTLVGVAMDARMGEIYAAAYRLRRDDWQTVEAPMLVDPEALAAHWLQTRPGWVAGSALEVHAAPLAGAMHVAIAMPRMTHAVQALATLARRAWRDGATLHARDAQPLYVRDKVAFTTREREAMRVGATTDHPTGA